MLCKQQGPKSAEVKRPESQSYLCHLWLTSKLSFLTSKLWGTWDRIRVLNHYAKNELRLSRQWLLQPLEQHWGSVPPTASSFYPNVPYKYYHFLRENLRATDHEGEMKIFSPRREASTKIQEMRTSRKRRQLIFTKPQVLKSTVRDSAWGHAALGEASQNYLRGQQTSRKPDLCGKRPRGLAKWKPGEILSSRCSQPISCQQQTLSLKFNSGAKEIIFQACLV